MLVPIFCIETLYNVVNDGEALELSVEQYKRKSEFSAAFVRFCE